MGLKPIKDLDFFHYIGLSIANIKACSFLLLMLFSSTVNAVNTAILDVAVFKGKGITLEGVTISVINLNLKKPQFRLSATQLHLPKPFHDLGLVDIRCRDFSWNNTEIHCRRGRASVRSAFWQSPTTDFSFHLGPTKNTIQFDNAQLAGSLLTLKAEMAGDNWQSTFSLNRISHPFIKKLCQVMQVTPPALTIKQGQVNLQGVISGSQRTLGQFALTAGIEELTGQMDDGKIAAENVKLFSHWVGKKSKDNWIWQSDTQFVSGALYADPVYLEAGQQPITLAALGNWNTQTKQINIQSFNYQHPTVASVSGNVMAYLAKAIIFDQSHLQVQSHRLQDLLSTYVNPFLTDSPFTGITASGDLQARFSFQQQALTDAFVSFSQLQVNDEAGRLAIKEGVGSINWSNDPLQTKYSVLGWQQLSIKGLPFESALVKFSSQANAVKLAEKVKLPFYNGFITVDLFSWWGKQQEEPDVSFAGSLNKVSLEQLTKALGWTTLLGHLSGQIPGIHYHHKILSLDGELLVNVFDGLIKVNNLTASGIFAGYPKISGDVIIENIDLDQLTRKFEFGNITGRLSGYVHKLILENWHPMTFFAWLGTPDDDDSRHRISQKAVNNIASIGGGGATDLVSRTFLGFFETFGYDKIGVGCYLQNGVCQMMGLAAREKGYSLIKGGGLPRIDVVGYNPQVNWDVLVERLGRVASPNQVIVH